MQVVLATGCGCVGWSPWGSQTKATPRPPSRAGSDNDAADGSDENEREVRRTPIRPWRLLERVVPDIRQVCDPADRGRLEDLDRATYG